MEGFGDHIAVGCELVLESVGDAAGVHVHDGDGWAAGVARHGGDEKTDGAGADYEGCRARGGRCAVDGVDGDGKGFEESSGVEGDVGGESVLFMSLSSLSIWQSYKIPGLDGISKEREKHTCDTT